MAGSKHIRQYMTICD